MTTTTTPATSNHVDWQRSTEPLAHRLHPCRCGVVVGDHTDVSATAADWDPFRRAHGQLSP